MSENSFPYGNNPMNPEAWVGRSNTKSLRWLVSYDGSLSLACGYHSFIFLGLDSLAIGIANIYSCGLSLSLPIGKIFKAVGGTARDALTIEKFSEQVGNAKKVTDATRMEVEQNQTGSGIELYERMGQSIPQLIRADIPFSFDDLAGMPGAIAGAEIEMSGAASIYFIEGYEGLIGDKIFGPSQIANTGDGLVGAGIGISAGVWSVETPRNLYLELGAAANLRCQIEGQSPSYDQPYREILNLHPYLAALPPIGCSLSETGFNPMRMLP
ncbi:hypothetical protein [Paracoccus saliphilus]|uniref:Uncharacterized protein n=1 Tax=Paracoccus saliphilus TaxID=405559 RepID=A0AA46A4R9_9RHOB|nr:hypothetical protein [Paracoccus saliphilus]WCR02058.1 hypothetical protein JHX88_14225 [Paracoccus saliphilus]SIS67054.1 hypothetical protein SAMN05421772_102437 [Paracoccus saliphilus]